MKRGLLLLVVCLLTVASSVSAANLTYVDLVGRMTDLESLAVLPSVGEKCAQWSSYDRKSAYDAKTGKYVGWAANGDGKGIIREEDGKVVMAEIQGPGVITRIWSAAPKDGHVRIYLDGATTPAVDLPFKGYFDRQNAPFVYKSLVNYTAAGANCYVPIPFQKSCKIVADKDWGNYYHFTYTTFPKDTVVPVFTRDLTTRERLALRVADHKLSSDLGTDPQVVGTKDSVNTSVAVAPGKRTVVARFTGPQAITCLRVKIDEAKYSAEDLRNVVLRIYFDGEKEPSVWSPIADFFGSAPGINKYKSLPLGMTDDGLYSYWYMPFATSAVIEVVNESAVAFSAPFSINYAKLSKPISELGRFHAKWHRDAFLPADRTIDWTMLKTEGRGRFCGVALEVWNPKGGWWGEGDEKFFVDGEKFPSTIGTGSEDYFGYAWCNPALFQNAFHNQTRNDGDNVGHVSVNRWHITDNVPFQKSFEAAIEKYYPNAKPTTYACTVYWYQEAGEADSYKPVMAKDRVGMYPTPVAK